MPTILLKKSDTPGSVPGTANLTNLAGGAEVAVNTADKRMFSMTSASAVIELGTNPSSLTCADASFTVARVGSLTISSLSLTNATFASATITNLTSTSATISSALTLSGGTANGVLYLNGSKVATSGSALQFDGTNLGIGTTSPSSQIQVVGSTFAIMRLSAAAGDNNARVDFGTAASPDIARIGYNNSTNAFTFRTNGTDAVTINSSQNVGIGTSSPSTKLNVVGTVTVDGVVDVNGGQIDLDTGQPIRWGGAASSIYAGSGTNDMVFTVGSSERFRVNGSSGNLGIGTSSPSTNLQIGNGSSNSLGIFLSRGATTNFLETYDGTKTFIAGTDASNGFVKVGSLSNHPVAIVQANGAALYIDTSQNVGIGTASPATRLHVQLEAATETDIARFRVTNGANNHFLDIGADEPNKLVIFDSTGSAAGGYVFRAGGTERMRLDSSGNLGITEGNNPTQALSLYRSGSTNCLMSAGNSNTGVNGSLFGVDGTGNAVVNNTQNFAVLFSTNNTERARIDTSGNLLVGTTSGSYKIQSTVASGADRDMFISGVTGVTNGVNWKWIHATSKINVFFSALPTTASAANAYIDNAAGDQLLRSTSSIRYKKDVEDIDHAFADSVLNLRPVWYRSKAEGDKKEWSWYGLIAEEVAEVEPRLVHWTYPEDAFDVETVDGVIKKTVKDGAERIPDGVQYERLSVLLLDIVKRQNARLEQLEAKVAALEVK